MRTIAYKIEAGRYIKDIATGISAMQYTRWVSLRLPPQLKRILCG